MPFFDVDHPIFLRINSTSTAKQVCRLPDRPAGGAPSRKQMLACACRPRPLGHLPKTGRPRFCLRIEPATRPPVGSAGQADNEQTSCGTSRRSSTSRRDP